MSAPRYIALCGAPKSGKSSVAEYLEGRFGAQVVDDGAVLREAAVPLFGGTMVDYTTQEGKSRVKTICDKQYDNRNLLGQLGNLLEGHFGEQFMPERALMAADEIDGREICSGRRPLPFFVFGSARKRQGISYRRRNGVVIEIVRPGHVPVNDFDHYDKSLVSYTIGNNGSLESLLFQADELLRGLGHIPT